MSLEKRTWLDAGKLGEFFWGHEPQDLVYLFAKNDKLFNNIPSKGGAFPYSTMQRHAPLLKLPTEILVQIFRELDMQSCLRLTISCRQLWHIGWDILEQWVRKWWLSQSWAGSRIIVLGEYCDQDKLPQGLLTEVDRKWLEDGLDQGDLDYAVKVGNLDEDHGMIPGPSSITDLLHIAHLKVRYDGPDLIKI